MDVVIEERGREFTEKLKQKSDEIRKLLKKSVEPDAVNRLLVLAEGLLRYSHSHVLLSLSTERLLDWLLTFDTFLSCREEQAHVRAFLPEDHDQSYLLVNTCDVPYLVDSLQMLFQRLQQRAIIISHPVLNIERDADGQLVRLGRENLGERESFMLIQVDCSRSDLDGLIAQVLRILGYSQQVGRDQKSLKQRLERLAEFAANQDQVDFIEWLQQGNFICFGYAAISYDYSDQKTLKNLGSEIVGWLPDGLFDGVIGSDSRKKLPDAIHHRLVRKNAFVVEVLEQMSLLHRPEALVYLGFRVDLPDGSSCEHAFVGLFSQTSINELTFNIPSLKSKVKSALDRQHVMRDSYDYRKVVEIFNTFPKVELFFLDDDEMDRLVLSFVSLQRYQTVKVVVTRSLSLRGVTLLLIMPREFYSRATIGRLEAYLGRYLNALRLDSKVIHFYSDYLSLHVRAVPQADRVRIDIDRLEKTLTDLARPWSDRLRNLLVRDYGNRQGTSLWQKYAAGLPNEYKALIHPRFAIRDVRNMERILADGDELFDLWGPFRAGQEFFRLQFYSLEESCLNELMPFLENLNLTVVDEVDFNIVVVDRVVHIKSFSVRNAHPEALPLGPQRENLLEILNGLRRGQIEDDYLNRLLVLTGLDWKQIDVFRAYRNYYFQIGNPFTKRRVAFTLINNPQVAQLLSRYFDARFEPNPEWLDPVQREEAALMPIRMELAEALDTVDDINEDRILRSLFNLIDSTIRTNFFLRRDSEDYFLSFKISAIGIIDMPFPRPLYETYVHSSSMEGIHLRGGKVARGGIRWSDRPDDFRTEVLGLMKTQMTKNALIVPVGSKGGFIVKKAFTTREEGAELSRQAYITLMRGLLDLVDDRVAGEVVRPEGVVVYDDEDPYLVVAADKGTAHLPDTANGVSNDYGFWLGDAFASGGSVGYDHKKLGITARGAWECVKRHFRELDKDIQAEDFTVVGIGDMGGDVFGNGMLLSRHIRLLAAFNHQHIFLDPDPVAEASWAERERLFALPRSSWADYNPELISVGGGVYERSAKDIPLSPEVRQWLGVRHASMDGEGLIRRLLTAEAELLWNGGIGTYVKASQEKHADVGDRANDNVRVNADQLKVRVIGEGGNLGLTQQARIEFALNGGCLNTDSIDNSAGVDISDHEVNLKILFRGLRESEVIKTDRTRNKQLIDAQDEVSEMVLKNNYTQSLCLSLDQMRCDEDVEMFVDLSARLSNAGLLDREGEFLPTRKDLTSRGHGYTRPELAILVSYSKMHLFKALLESDLPDRETVQDFLHQYFPKTIRRRYGKYLHDHPLRREIIATMMTNRVVDQAGCTFLHALTRHSGASIIQGVTAYMVFDEVLRGEQVRAQIFAGDNRMMAARQHELLLDLESTIAGLSGQVVEQGMPMRLDQDCVDDYQERLKIFRAHLKDLLPADEWQVCQDDMLALVADGFEHALAEQMASFKYLVGFLPAVHIAETTGVDLFEVTEVMSRLRQRLQFRLVNTSLNNYMAHDRWDRLAQFGLRSSFVRAFVNLSHAVVSRGGTVSDYLGERRQRVEYYNGLVDTVKATTPTSTSPYMVLLRALETLLD